MIEAVSPRGDMAGKEEGLVEVLSSRVTGTPTRLGVIGGASSLLVEEGGPRLIDTHQPPAEVLPEIETGIRILDTLKASPEALDWFYVSPARDFGAWVPAPDTGSYRLGGDVLHHRRGRQLGHLGRRPGARRRRRDREAGAPPAPLPRGALTSASGRLIDRSRASDCAGSPDP